VWSLLTRRQIDYPINNTNIGRGEQNDIVFPSNTRTTFTFPFMIAYRMDHDPDNRVLLDLATKCGVIGGRRTDISVKYKITVGFLEPPNTCRSGLNRAVSRLACKYSLSLSLQSSKTISRLHVQYRRRTLLYVVDAISRVSHSCSFHDVQRLLQGAGLSNLIGGG
jgi:hypothetical protein